MITPVRFEDEADAEYREAGRWYDAKQTGLGIEFFDEVDAPSGEFSIFLAPAYACRECVVTCPFGVLPLRAFHTM